MAVLIQDTFDGSGSPDGREPDVGPPGLEWAAFGDVILDGGGVTNDAEANGALQFSDSGDLASQSFTVTTVVQVGTASGTAPPDEIPHFNLTMIVGGLELIVLLRYVTADALGYLAAYVLTFPGGVDITDDFDDAIPLIEGDFYEIKVEVTEGSLVVSLNDTPLLSCTGWTYDNADALTTISLSPDNSWNSGSQDKTLITDFILEDPTVFPVGEYEEEGGYGDPSIEFYVPIADVAEHGAFGGYGHPVAIISSAPEAAPHDVEPAAPAGGYGVHELVVPQLFDVQAASAAGGSDAHAVTLTENFDVDVPAAGGGYETPQLVLTFTVGTADNGGSSDTHVLGFAYDVGEQDVFGACGDPTTQLLGTFDVDEPAAAGGYADPALTKLFRVWPETVDGRPGTPALVRF